MFTRRLGRSGIQVSALGMGCWAIGGPTWRDGRPVGWGEVDDEESVDAIRRAVDLGITFFDTANVYGAGHSERVLGRALAGRRDEVVIATKFGGVADESTRQITGQDATREGILAACDASLERLGTDRIDLYQFHIGNHELDRVDEVRGTLEDLVAAGKIRSYGWSTDDPERARRFAEGEHCTAVQQRLNIFEGNPDTLAVCEELDLASVNRSPLAMGLLTGKFDHDTRLPADDVRHRWDLTAGTQAKQLRDLRALREVLTADGHSLAQAALSWLWARSEATVPIPGCRTATQVEENAAAADHGPLSADQMAQIDAILTERDAPIS